MVEEDAAAVRTHESGQGRVQAIGDDRNPHTGAGDRPTGFVDHRLRLRRPGIGECGIDQLQRLRFQRIAQARAGVGGGGRRRAPRGRARAGREGAANRGRQPDHPVRNHSLDQWMGGEQIRLGSRDRGGQRIDETEGADFAGARRTQVREERCLRGGECGGPGSPRAAFRGEVRHLIPQDHDHIAIRGGAPWRRRGARRRRAEAQGHDDGKSSPCRSRALHTMSHPPGFCWWKYAGRRC